MTLTRIQNRRGTAAQWTAGNPTLAPGEIGFETDTGKFKIGNGNTVWNSLGYYQNSTEIIASIVDGAPATLNTLNEIAAAIADDSSFATTVLNEIADKAPTNSPTFTGNVSFSGATISGLPIRMTWQGEYVSGPTYVEGDVVVMPNNGGVYYAAGTNINGSYIPGSVGADWELLSGPAYNITASTNDPQPGIGVDGDIWFKYNV